VAPVTDVRLRRLGMVGGRPWPAVVAGRSGPAVVAGRSGPAVVAGRSGPAVVAGGLNLDELLVGELLVEELLEELAGVALLDGCDLLRRPRGDHEPAAGTAFWA
jgi:hypothetical protein